MISSNNEDDSSCNVDCDDIVVVDGHNDNDGNDEVY